MQTPPQRKRVAAAPALSTPWGVVLHSFPTLESPPITFRPGAPSATTGAAARVVAARVLLDEAPDSEFLERRLEEASSFNTLPPADRRLAAVLALGVTRWRRTLDELIDRRTDGRPLPPVARTALRLGLYQLFWLDRVPEFAVVQTSVEVAKILNAPGLAGLINAILRGYARARDATERLLDNWRETDPALALSHPAWLYERWQSRWGRADACRLAQWNNAPPNVFARVNTLRASTEDLTRRWSAEGVRFEEARHAWIPRGLAFKIDCPSALAALGSFTEGWFYVQDPSTLLAPLQLAPAPGERILDLCAAPGGKATLMAQLASPPAQIIAHEPHPERRARMKENFARLRAENVVSCSSLSDPVAAGPFDAALVDSPCSNSGVLRRRIEARWRLQPADLSALARTQLTLLESAAQRLKPGGRLAYSTCSVEFEENEGVADAFAAGHPEFEAGPRKSLTPITDGVDGAFVALFRREGRPS